MNATNIFQLAKATQTSSLAFSEVIVGLVQEGVEHYLVDFRSLQFHFYGVHGGVVTAPMVFDGLPEVHDTFNSVALKDAIHDSQLNGQTFRNFASRAMLAGVQSYSVFLTGKRVLYLGRQGDHHVEWFPGASPLEV